MRIAFDVDGVFTNLEKYQLKYGKKYFKNVKTEDINTDEIDIEGMFNCTKSEREKFWLKYIWKYCFMPFEEDIGALIRKLKSEGDEIYIVTGRAHTTEQGLIGALFRKMLYYMLKKENVPYDHMFFCSEKDSEIEKPKICEENEIDVIVDDKKENVDSMKDVTNVICRDRIYNRNYDDKAIPRVKNSNQIYNEIRKIKNASSFVKLSHEEVDQMSNEQKIEYYKNLKDYYLDLPFDQIKNNKTEKNYKRLSKVGLFVYDKFVKPTVFNRELVPDDNGLMFISNHNNYYDQFPIISAIGDHRPIHFLTATKMLNMKRGAIYLKTGAVSIDREDKDDRDFAKDQVSKILAHGGNVFIFPEGRTNRGEDFLLPFHPGAAAIAQSCGCKIVPVAVTDNYDRKKGEPCVRFGEPFKVLPTDNVLDATIKMQEIIGQLKQENIDYLESTKTKQKIK